MHISTIHSWLSCVPFFHTFLHCISRGSLSYYLQHSLVICLSTCLPIDHKHLSEKSRAYSYLNLSFLSQCLAHSKLSRDVSCIELKWLSLGFNSRLNRWLTQLAQGTSLWSHFHLHPGHDLDYCQSLWNTEKQTELWWVKLTIHKISLLAESRPSDQSIATYGYHENAVMTLTLIHLAKTSFHLKNIYAITITKITTFSEHF